MPVEPVVPAAPVVPGYVLEELLGRGGSGQVWRARPRSGGEPVAVKVLVRGDPERQVREAALLAELDHPHLVRLHRVVQREMRGGGPAEVSLVLDLLAGGSLASLLARRGRLRPGEVVTAIAPVAAALAQAHERGIVHGDLSPGNIVFTAEGRPVLTDLGTARLVGETGRAEVTPPYVDPVVARGGAPGPASDVFGVAAAAFHALTGIAPWNAADPSGTLTVAAGGQLPDLPLLAPGVPPELVRVVTRGLSLEPHLRGSAADFALDLRHACRPEPIRLPSPGVPDEVLGETGHGPRTELTHQVADRRPRGAHAVPVEVGRIARWRSGWAQRDSRYGVRLAEGRGPAVALLRRCALGLTVLLAVGGGLAGAAWIGASWGGRGTTDPVPAAETGRLPVGVSDGAGSPGASSGRAPAAPPLTGAPESTSTGAATAAPGPATSGTSAPGGPAATEAKEPTAGPGAVSGPAASGAAERPQAPDDAAGWSALLSELYARRAGAYATADPSWLAGVYTPDSALLRRDTDQVRALASAGQALAGFQPTVRRVSTVTGDHAKVVLDLVDEVPDYRVVPLGDRASAPPREMAGRGPVDVQMTLRRMPEGWRIADAIRHG